MKNYLLLILFVFTNILFAQNPADSDGVLYPTPTGTNLSYDAIVTYTIGPNIGKTIIGGNFTSFTDPNGTQHTNLGNIIRLNEDGSRDITFNPGGIGFNPIGTIVNPTIKTIAIQSDGKILVGGHFTSFNGAPQKRLIRLNEDGTKDTDFITGVTTPYTLTSPGGDIQMEGDSKINTIVVQSDGKILVGGQFTKYNNISAPVPENTHANIVRLNADGTKDTTFDIGDGFITSGNPTIDYTRVLTINIQTDGKILVGGQFTTFNNIASNNCLIRLNSDGSKDETFNTQSGFNTNEKVSVIKTQYDGKVFIGGTFNNYQETDSNKLIRLKGETATLASDTFQSSNIKVSLYPNPTTDYLNISTSQDITSYEIYDINGRTIISSKTNDKSINVSNLTNGMYIINIKTYDGNTSSKFIKN